MAESGSKVFVPLEALGPTGLQQATEVTLVKETAEVQNFPPHRDSAAETSARLRNMR